MAASRISYYGSQEEGQQATATRVRHTTTIRIRASLGGSRLQRLQTTGAYYEAPPGYHRQGRQVQGQVQTGDT